MRLWERSLRSSHFYLQFGITVKIKIVIPSEVEEPPVCSHREEPGQRDWLPYPSRASAGDLCRWGHWAARVEYANHLTAAVSVSDSNLPPAG